MRGGAVCDTAAAGIALPLTPPMHCLRLQGTVTASAVPNSSGILPDYTAGCVRAKRTPAAGPAALWGHRRDRAKRFTEHNFKRSYMLKVCTHYTESQVAGAVVPVAGSGRGGICRPCANHRKGAYAVVASQCVHRLRYLPSKIVATPSCMACSDARSCTCSCRKPPAAFLTRSGTFSSGRSCSSVSSQTTYIYFHFERGNIAGMDKSFYCGPCRNTASEIRTRIQGILC